MIKSLGKSKKNKSLIPLLSFLVIILSFSIVLLSNKKVNLKPGAAGPSLAPINPATFDFTNCPYKILINEAFLGNIVFVAPSKVMTPVRVEAIVIGPLWAFTSKSIKNLKVIPGPFKWRPSFIKDWTTTYGVPKDTQVVAMGIIAWDNMDKELRIACGFYKRIPRAIESFPTVSPKASPFPTRPPIRF